MSEAESDDVKPASKKRKATRACDRCNSQHQPCDNALPKCSVCDRAGTSCTYDRPVRKRGPRSGYTGQNGERLWSIVLQARPDLEDLVLQIIRDGTYRDTGISNLDYYKNNDNQGELVNQFNESRLGRFLQHGESPDLLLPPVDRSILTAPLPGSLGYGAGSSSNPSGQAARASIARHGRGRSLSSGLAAQAAGFIDTLGGPQNPGDLYVQSEDLRRRASYQSRSHDDSGGDSNGRSVSGGLFDGVGSQGFGSGYSLSLKNSAEGNSIGPGYRHLPSPDFRRDTPRENHNNSNSSISTTPQSFLSGMDMAGLPGHEHANIEAASTAHWFEPIPEDTLLHLGFAQGEGMTSDFLELCENPDPVESSTTDVAKPNEAEDEEEVWRRLVMRGRFV